MSGHNKELEHDDDDNHEKWNILNIIASVNDVLLECQYFMYQLTVECVFLCHCPWKRRK